MDSVGSIGAIGRNVVLGVPPTLVLFMDVVCTACTAFTDSQGRQTVSGTSSGTSSEEVTAVSFTV